MSTTFSSDPIADMLTRMRNAIAIHKQQISLPDSKIKSAVAQLLKANGFIVDVKSSGNGVDKVLTITLENTGAASKISSIDRLSKPGRRYYVSADAIPTVRQGRGIVIVSTSKGLMTGEDARKQHIGGELICKVY